MNKFFFAAKQGEKAVFVFFVIFFVCTKTRLTKHLDSFQFLPTTIFGILRNYFGNEVRLVLDTGSFCTIGEHLWPADNPLLFLSSGNSRYMGTALPMAIGASIFDPKVPTIAVVGDGGIGMYISELRLAVKYKLPLLVLLLSDGGYGSIRSQAIRNGLNQDPLVFSDSSWLAVMDGFGVSGYKVSDEDTFSNSISHWKPSEGPFFIECHFEPDKYMKMTQGLRH